VSKIIKTTKFKTPYNEDCIYQIDPATQTSLTLGIYLLLHSFHRFGQAKFPNGGLVSDSSQISILPQLPPKILLDSRVVKIDQKIIILHR